MRSVISLFVFILIWCVGSYFLPPLFIPSPVEVANSIFIMCKNGLLLKSLLFSFLRISVATLFSISISLAVGLLIVNSKKAEKVIKPITDLCRYIPVTAFYPLLIMWIGIGEPMKVTFLFIATFLFFLPNCIQAFQDINVRIIETGKTMGMSKIQIIKFIILPYSAPSLVKSFLTMYAIGWTYIVVAESVNVVNGIGYLINIGSARGRTDMVFSSIFIMIFLNWAFDKIGNKIIEKKFKWKIASTAEGSSNA